VPETLGDFWLDYTKLQHALKRLLRTGVKEGDFKDMDVELTSMAFLCLDEGLQKRFRTQQRTGDRSDLPFHHRAYTAEQYASFAATTSICSVLVDPVAIEKVQTMADEFDDFAVARALSSR
jgi:hypothetical protein